MPFTRQATVESNGEPAILITDAESGSSNKAVEGNAKKNVGG
jgi:hypothetical protein